MDVVRKLILDKLQELDLNMAEVSKRLGRNETYLQQFLKRGSPRELHERDRIRLAEILSVSEEQLRGPSSTLPKREYVKANQTTRESLIAEPSRRPRVTENQQPMSDFIPASQLVGDRDLPVFGTAQGGSGALIVSNEPVDWVVRPDPLLRVKDGYGMIVTGDSMDPALRARDRSHLLTLTCHLASAIFVCSAAMTKMEQRTRSSRNIAAKLKSFGRSASTIRQRTSL
jgi:hypothetical protein